MLRLATILNLIALSLSAHAQSFPVETEIAFTPELRAAADALLAELGTRQNSANVMHTDGREQSFLRALDATRRQQLEELVRTMDKRATVERRAKLGKPNALKMIDKLGTPAWPTIPSHPVLSCKWGVPNDKSAPDPERTEWLRVVRETLADLHLSELNEAERSFMPQTLHHARLLMALESALGASDAAAVRNAVRRYRAWLFNGNASDDGLPELPRFDLGAGQPPDLPNDIPFLDDVAFAALEASQPANLRRQIDAFRAPQATPPTLDEYRVVQRDELTLSANRFERARIAALHTYDEERDATLRELALALEQQDVDRAAELEARLVGISTQRRNKLRERWSEPRPATVDAEQMQLGDFGLFLIADSHALQDNQAWAEGLATWVQANVIELPELAPELRRDWDALHSDLRTIAANLQAGESMLAFELAQQRRAWLLDRPTVER